VIRSTARSTYCNLLVRLCRHPDSGPHRHSFCQFSTLSLFNSTWPFFLVSLDHATAPDRYRLCDNAWVESDADRSEAAMCHHPPARGVFNNHVKQSERCMPVPTRSGVAALLIAVSCQWSRGLDACCSKRPGCRVSWVYNGEIYGRGLTRQALAEEMSLIRPHWQISQQNTHIRHDPCRCASEMKT